MVRIIVGSPVGDPHLSGADGLARALRDAGHEVIWAGPGLSPEQLAATALQEDAALVGVAVPPGEGSDVEREVAAQLAALGVADIGVRVFEAGTPIAEIRSWATPAG